jgi:hypothetical protein
VRPPAEGGAKGRAAGAGGATQTRRVDDVGDEPHGEEAGAGKRQAAAAAARGRPGEKERQSRNAASNRGLERTSSRAESTAGSTVENGRVAKRKYSAAPNSLPPT